MDFETNPNKNDLENWSNAEQSLLEDKEATLTNYSGEEEEDHENSESPKPQKSSPTTVSFNIINSAIGGSILGYPYAIRQLGLILGTLMIIFSGILTCFSVAILQKVKNLSKKSSYLSIAQACLKRPGHTLASIFILANTVGGCIIYLVVFTTTVQNILGAFVPICRAGEDSPAFYCKAPVITTFGGLIVLPLNFVKSFAKLKFISVIKIIAILIFTTITIGFAIYKAAIGNIASDISLFPNISEPVSMIATVPQILFGFNFLYNQFSLFKTLKDPTDKKFNNASKISVFFIALVYLIVGICGYVIYGSSTDNVLKNFTQNDLGTVWFTVLNIAFMICALGGIPVTYLPARDIFYEGTMKRVAMRVDKYAEVHVEESSSVSGEINDRGYVDSKGIFVLVTLISNVLIIVVAIVAPNLNQVLGLIGSIGSSGLMFLLPMAFYVMLSHWKGKHKITAIAVFVFGVLVAIGGFTTNLIKIIGN